MKEVDAIKWLKGFKPRTCPTHCWWEHYLGQLLYKYSCFLVSWPFADLVIRSCLIPRYIIKKISLTCILEDVHSDVYSSMIHNVEKLEANQIPIDKGIDCRLNLREEIHTSRDGFMNEGHICMWGMSSICCMLTGYIGCQLPVPPKHHLWSVLNQKSSVY